MTKANWDAYYWHGTTDYKTQEPSHLRVHTHIVDHLATMKSLKKQPPCSAVLDLLPVFSL